ncbi:UbiA family prenyltransferase [Hyphococcus luteus]|uniref:UbiA family prenyltransferase n=1 Tax=Hyphococcus luteus TaxID=2058213 RepID=UPI0013FDAB5A|nr:UbiA family prenyltransferase [Marinicaulis flavus]
MGERTAVPREDSRTRSRPGEGPNGGETRALFVDLDGTLIHGDTLWEAAAALAGKNAFSFLACLPSLMAGRAAFKASVASRLPTELGDLRLNEEVFAYVKTESEDRPVVLATAAHKSAADAIAEEAGFFHGVIASDGENFKSGRKLAAIRAYSQAHGFNAGFDYAGDSKADRPIWKEAETAYVAAPDDASARALTGGHQNTVRLAAAKASLKDYLKAMRLHQWVKNVLIFLPLVLSHQIFEVGKVLDALAAFVGFSLCASATYIVNDILDIRADRRHPRKMNRPFAAGRIPIPQGIFVSALLLAASFAIAFLFTSPLVALLFAGYIVFTLTYSLYLKEKLLVDAMALGILYGYRILIGGAASGVVVSDWLIAFSVFFFLGLALVKRYTEISQKTPNADGKIPGRGYYAHDREIVSHLGVVASYTSILILALYITSPNVTVLYQEPRILWVICLVMIYWLGRIWTLAHRGQMPDDPIVFALRDKVSLLCGLICAGAILLAV